MLRKVRSLLRDLLENIPRISSRMIKSWVIHYASSSQKIISEGPLPEASYGSSVIISSKNEIKRAKNCVKMSRADFQYYQIGKDSDLSDILRELPRRPRRGDLILDSIERGLPTIPGDPYTDRGYRHNGIYIFNGEQLETLAGEPDDYGSIPEEFQVVVEFPPMYWSHVLNHSSYVPFDLKRHLGTIAPEYIHQIIRVDGTGSHLAYPFTHQNQLYAIVDFDSKRPTPERIQHFIQGISEMTHFQTLLPRITKDDPLSLPPDLSYERILLFSEETI